jgi:hypothetical protein
MTPVQRPGRQVFCEDALAWLERSPVLDGCSLVGSLPDISEFQTYTLDQWKNWFLSTAKLILSRCPQDGVVIFYQSDIKQEGQWVDKGHLCQKAAEELNFHLLWHKIACRFPAGTVTFGRPAYSHILCFSKGVVPDLGKSTADVIPELGEKTWVRGMGLEATVMIAKFVAEQTASRTLVNIFCGEGSMLAAANKFHLNSIGIERRPKRAEKARSLQLSDDLKSWLP